MKIEIELSESDVNRIKQITPNIEDFVKTALYRSLYNMDNIWQKHIELKIEQLQSDLDMHRVNSKDDSYHVLDSDLGKRITNEKCKLDVNDFSDLRQSEYKPKPKNKPKSDRDRSDAPIAKNIDINF